ncbi:MAG TPA: hypothetical protein VMT20_15070 [Terriglobia bacterium]|nr:hypothetical protein [Terriglobia bacterium]
MTELKDKRLEAAAEIRNSVVTEFNNDQHENWGNVMDTALRVTGADELAEALETFAAFADALSEDAPDNIALGLICGGSTHIGPGACTIGGLRKARAALARYKELKNG